MTAATVRRRPFAQVDVFTSTSYFGNPVAVILDGSDLDGETMARVARWTNLSETTFLLPPTDPAADYRLRIFTPTRELPFAGHPTLGSAHAWLAAGGRSQDAATVVQECGAGLVPIRRHPDRLAFAAPGLVRTGPLEPEPLAQLANALGLTGAAIVEHQWVDNGPGWAALLLRSADEVRALEPDFPALGPHLVGVIGPERPGADVDYEVRAFAPGAGVPEDPVTGSFNAGAAQWLIGSGRAPKSYVVAQGTRLGRAGRVVVESADGSIWVGGNCVTAIRGDIDI